MHIPVLHQICNEVQAFILLHIWWHRYNCNGKANNYLLNLWEANCLCREEWLWNFLLFVNFLYFWRDFGDTMIELDWSFLAFGALEWHYIIWLYIGTYCYLLVFLSRVFPFLKKASCGFQLCSCNHVFLS